MPRKLKWSEVGEVSLVDAGANLKGRFPITKGLEMDFKDKLEAALETPVEGEDEIKKHADADDEQAALVALYRFADACGIDKSVFADADADDDNEEAEDVDKDAEAEDNNQDEEMNEDIQKKFESLQKQLDDEKAARASVEERLEKAKDEKELAEWVGKVKENLTFVPGDFADLAKNLHETAKLSPELADAQYERMLEVNGMLQKSKAFEAVGTGGNRETSHEEFVAKRQAELLAKNDKMLPSQALRQAALEAEKANK